MVKPDWEATRRELIDTYKTLNHRVRGRSEDELSADHNGESIRAEIAAMRGHELQFAKALSAALLGEAAVRASEDEEAVGVTGVQSEDDPTNLLISQFGSARATTLNTMSSLDDEAWERPLIDNRRMLDLAKELAESDRAHMDKITRMLGA
jgi:hypothetical protein